MYQQNFEFKWNIVFAFNDSFAPCRRNQIILQNYVLLHLNFQEYMATFGQAE